MKPTFFLLLFISISTYGQWKEFKIGVKGDTLNKVDQSSRRQGKWVLHVDPLRGEPGYEEEGEYKDNRKEGMWREYDLEGDLIGVENYKWGNRDGVCRYFTGAGELLREESWHAMNPDKPYDTLEIEDIDHLNEFKTVIVKNEGVAIKHGNWNYYSPATGMILRTETYTMGKLETHKENRTDSGASTSSHALVKPKEVQDYERKNSGKKNIKVRDGTVGQ